MSDKKLIFAESTGDDSFLFSLEPYENDGRTVFGKGETARVKIYPGGKKPKLNVSSGRSYIHMEGLKQRVVQFLIFKDTKEVSAKYPIESIHSYKWEGASAGKPLFLNNKVAIQKEHTGVLRLEYETTYDLIDVTSESLTYVLVTAKADGLEGFFSLDFTLGQDNIADSRQVVLNVKDACTRERLDSAVVYINEKYAGKTDSDGRLRLGSLNIGTYSLRIEKEGYKPTDKDSLRNDYFTVE
jgi:hypothetical protein